MKLNFMEPGNTPLTQIKSPRLANTNLFLKHEYFNPTGSAKDRSAHYVIGKLLETKQIGNDTIIIESSSGNFGIALSVYCKLHGLDFYCVVDPNISPVNEMLIESMSTRVIKVTEPDENGGYLLNRIRKVKQMLEATPNMYWINQYKNSLMAEAYYCSLGKELCEELNLIDYVFVGVSSGGTITGISQKVKERFPDCKIIAVDVEGSIIFGGQPKKRTIPGIGSSMTPEILKDALIDDVVIVDECVTVQMCHELLRDHSIFSGGSSGSVYAAACKYFENKPEIMASSPNVVLILADRGERYFPSIYGLNRVASQIS